MSLQKMKDNAKKQGDIIIRIIAHILPKQPKSYTPEDIVTWWIHNNKDISTYSPKCAVRGICGAVCIGLGVSTLWLPSGSIPLIIIGSGLLGYDVKALSNRVKYELNLFKLRYF